MENSQEPRYFKQPKKTIQCLLNYKLYKKLNEEELPNKLPVNLYHYIKHPKGIPNFVQHYKFYTYTYLDKYYI